MSERGGSPEQAEDDKELRAKLDELFPKNGEGKRQSVHFQGKGNGGEAETAPAEAVAEQSAAVAEGEKAPTLAEVMEALDVAAAEPTPAEHYAATYGSEEGGVEPIKSAAPSPEEEKLPAAKPPKPRSRPREQPDPIHQPDIEDILLYEPVVAPQKEPSTPEPTTEPPAQAPPTPEPEPKVAPTPPEPATATDSPPPALKTSEPLKFHAVNMDEQARSRALQAAEHRLQQEITESKGPKGLINRIWKGSLAHEYYRQHYAAEAEAEMRSSDNQLVAEGKSQEAYRYANRAVIERLTAHQDNPDIETHRGEHIEKMGTSEAEQEFQGHIRELIGRYTRDKLSAEDLQEERTRLFNQVRGADVLEGAHMMADNLIAVAEQARARVQHGEALKDMLAGIEFYADEARAGVRTEVRRTAVDKVVEKITGSRFGSLVNEATVASAVAIAYSAATVGGRHTLGNAVAVVPGVASGVFAGMRENTRFKQERAQHLRESAEGATIEPTGRRANMERSRYESESAQQIIANLDLPINVSENLSASNARELLLHLAEARARSQISDIRSIDLISFSSVESVDDERFKLDLAIATTKANLRQWYEGAAGPERAILGDATSFDELLRVTTRAAEIDLAEAANRKDLTFFRMKARAVGTAAAKGLLIGSSIGILGQEAVAMVSPDQQGELESIIGGNGNKGGQGEHQTLLRSLFSEHAASGGHPPELTVSPTHTEASHFFEQVDGHNTVELPHGFVLRHHGAGEGMTLLNSSNQPVARDLHMGQDGFTPQSQEALRAAGVTHEQAFVPVSAVHRAVETTSAREYFAHAPAGTAHVERTLWYDNNTSGGADQNELKLDWGNGGSGIDHGNYEFNVSHMTAAGSTHSELSANAQELMREGKLHLLLSASDTTQSHPFSIAIDSHGNATIPRESVAGRSLFSDNAGQAEFHGRYAEVAQVVGRARQGGVEQVRVLATTEGSGVNTIHHLVTRNQPELRLRTTLQVPGSQVSGGQTVAVEAAARAVPENSTDVPPIVSVNTGRRELQPANSEPNPPEAPTQPLPVVPVARGATSESPTEIHRARSAASRRPKFPPAPPATKAAAAKSRKKPSKPAEPAQPTEQPQESAEKPFLTGAEAARYHKDIEAAQNPAEITAILSDMAQRGYIKIKSGNLAKPEGVSVVVYKNVGSRLAKQAIARAQRMDAPTAPKPSQTPQSEV